MQKFFIKLSDLILFFKVNSIYKLVYYLKDNFLSRVKMIISYANVNLTLIQVCKTILYA